MARRRPHSDDLPILHTLAAGIDRDRDAVIAGLTLPWSSGAVEGHVNRIEMLKRQMFGRAGIQLLRKRVLLAWQMWVPCFAAERWRRDVWLCRVRVILRAEPSANAYRILSVLHHGRTQ